MLVRNRAMFKVVFFILAQQYRCIEIRSTQKWGIGTLNFKLVDAILAN